MKLLDSMKKFHKIELQMLHQGEVQAILAQEGIQAEVSEILI